MGKTLNQQQKQRCMKARKEEEEQRSQLFTQECVKHNCPNVKQHRKLGEQIYSSIADNPVMKEHLGEKVKKVAIEKAANQINETVH